MQVLHRGSGVATDGAQNLILRTNNIQEDTLIKLMTWKSITVSGFLEEIVLEKKLT